jgi:diguanylate cyclase (GGDEF)-like protein/PAS domain S-box-containing protein
LQSDILQESCVEDIEGLYRAVFEHSMEAVFLTEPDGVILAANPAACRLFGRTEEEICRLGRSGLVDSSSPQLDKFLTERARYGRVRAELVYIRGDGSRFPGEVSSEQFIDEKQRTRTVLTIRDLSERKQAEKMLAESEEQYRLLVAAMEEGVVLQDANAKILTFNKSAERILGLSKEQLTGKTSYDPDWYAIHEDGSPFPGETHPVVVTLRTGKPQSNVIMGIHKPDGTLTWISINSQPIFKQGASKPYRAVATMHDITESKTAQEHIERLAHFDQLTGLPNRTLLNDRFRYALSMAQRRNESLAIMFLDLDHFKDINDALGHNIGDLVLMELARRLKDTVREDDTLSRQGGDEYILILPATDADGAGLVASKLNEIVAQPCHVEQHELTVTASIGIAIYPHDGTNLESLSKNADIAMYRAKREERNSFRFYTPEMQIHSARNLKLANGLRHALERRELSLVYQPQFSLLHSQIVGVEALLRWRHPEMGELSPEEFIPIAESTGLIIPIGEWVLRTATLQLKAWMDSGLPPMTMAVNLSAVQFRQKNLTDVIDRILGEVKLPHHLLELELTEATTMENTQTAARMMDKLHSRGIRVSIDDFGTGYSSLSYLKQFRVYKLKIDKSFVRDITTDPGDKAIVTAIINMASSLELQTIAEGVETAQQLNFLRLQGCIEAQGYYFSRPLTAELFVEFARTAIEQGNQYQPDEHSGSEQ